MTAVPRLPLPSLPTRSGQAMELKRFCMDFILRHSKEVELDSLSCEPQLLLEITRVLMSRQKSG
jgi:hypothetical protein